MNDNKVWFDGDGYSPSETAPEMVSADQADKAIAEAVKKALLSTPLSDEEELEVDAEEKA